MAITPPYPIAVFSFDRPHYLEHVLRSLRAQTMPVDESQIFLFQDGYRSRVTGRDLTDPRKVEACIEMFARYFPGGRSLVAERNIGVGANIARGEDLLLGELGRQAAYFFEDDLILAPHYLTALSALTALALADKRIAYVAAYGDHHAPLSEQQRAPRRLIPMIHRWGFALTRRQWTAQREFVAPFLDLTARQDYRDRDHRAIRAYFRKLGYGSAGTGQDAIRDIASCILGTAKVMTFACFGKNIGEVGFNSGTKFYEREKFGTTEIYPDGVASFDPPSDAEIDRWVGEARAQGRAFVERNLFRRIRGLVSGG